MELPIRKLLLGKPVSEVTSVDAMANPDSLNFYIDFAIEKGTKSGAAGIG